MFSQNEFSQIFAGIGWVDIIAMVLILWGVITGSKRGLEKELVSLLEIVVATILSLRFYKSVPGFLASENSIVTYVTELLCFLGFVAVSIILIKLLFKLIGAVATITFISPLSRVGGALTGGIKSALIFGLISFFILMLPFQFLERAYGYGKSTSGQFFTNLSANFTKLTLSYRPRRSTPPEIPVPKKKEPKQEQQPVT